MENRPVFRLHYRGRLEADNPEYIKQLIRQSEDQARSLINEGRILPWPTAFPVPDNHSQALQAWLDVNPESHFIPLEGSNGQNFLLLPHYFALG